MVLSVGPSRAQVRAYASAADVGDRKTREFQNAVGSGEETGPVKGYGRKCRHIQGLSCCSALPPLANPLASSMWGSPGAPRCGCKSHKSQVHGVGILRADCNKQEVMGRDFAGRRYGPRPIDLDIIFYGDQHHQVQCRPTADCVRSWRYRGRGRASARRPQSGACPASEAFCQRYYLSW